MRTRFGAVGVAESSTTRLGINAGFGLFGVTF